MLIMRIGVSKALAMALLLSGCGNMGDSLKLQRAVLVKVPTKTAGGREPGGNGWEFRHVLEAPKTGGRRGEWYVAWNNEKPLAISAFSRLLDARFSPARRKSPMPRGRPSRLPGADRAEPDFRRVAAKQPPEPKPGER